MLSDDEMRTVGLHEDSELCWMGPTGDDTGLVVSGETGEELGLWTSLV